MDDATGAGQPRKGAVDDGDAQAEAGSDLGRDERTVGAGVAADDVTDRVAYRLEEGLGDTDRQRHSEGVLQAAGVLDGGPALLAGDPDADGTALLLERGQPLRRGTALDGLGGREVS